MTDLILTTFDWVPEMPRGYVHNRGYAGRWKRRGYLTVSRARHFANGEPDISRTSPSAKCPGWLTVTYRSSKAGPSCFILAS